MLLRVACLVIFPTVAWAGGLTLGEICRVKGQETNSLQGVGLVVGLRGTGDGGSPPTMRSLSRTMQLMGVPVTTDAAGVLSTADVADAKNVAMVFVTATLPAAGVQAGDVLDVAVHAIGAKSLEGGTLMLTPMLGPRTDNPTVYAMASGRLRVAADGTTTTATIPGGLKMETSLLAQFLNGDRFTLIIDRDFADFDTASRIEREINAFDTLTVGGNRGHSPAGGTPESFNPFSHPDAGGRGNVGAAGQVHPAAGPARAIDQLHVEVTVPAAYRDNPIKFIALVLQNIPVQLPSRGNRVVINESAGVVVIGEDVEIAPVLVTHRNLRIQAGGGGAGGGRAGGGGGGGGFVQVGPGEGPPAAKLKNLADALGALDVPTADLIAIIKTLKAKGDLYGEVIFR